MYHLAIQPSNNCTSLCTSETATQETCVAACERSVRQKGCVPRARRVLNHRPKHAVYVYPTFMLRAEDRDFAALSFF